jgi:hypothetical protein
MQLPKLSSSSSAKAGPEVEKGGVARKEIDALWDAVRKLLAEKVS